jgi:sugar transferase (PEP-CTERM system associated)
MLPKVEPNHDMDSMQFSDKPVAWEKMSQSDPTKESTRFVRAERKTKRLIGLNMQLIGPRFFVALGDLFFIVAAGLFSEVLRYRMLPEDIFMYLGTIIITMMVYPICFYIFDLYNVERFLRRWEVALRGALASVLGYMSVMFLFYLVITERPYGRVVFIIQMMLVWGSTIAWRWLCGRMFKSALSKTPVLILGADKCGRALCELLSSPASTYDVRGFLDDDPEKLGLRNSPAVLGNFDRLSTIARQTGADTAILAIPRNRSPQLIRKILEARLNGIEIRDMVDVYEELTGRIPVKYIGDQWLLFAEGFYLLHKEYTQKIKRIMDLTISGIMLIVTAPLMALITLGVRLESPGPILYRQVRVGKKEQNFVILKFRTMREDAEENGIRWAAENDPRVTKLGKWLRLTHIDELPQLWNVFKGDMSLIGPRPERPEFVTLLQNEVPYYFVRHSVRPGLTGWAQVNYRYGASVEDSWLKLECDLYYVKNMSLFLDVRIILRTIGVVLLGDGAR